LPRGGPRGGLESPGSGKGPPAVLPGKPFFLTGLIYAHGRRRKFGTPQRVFPWQIPPAKPFVKSLTCLTPGCAGGKGPGGRGVGLYKKVKAGKKTGGSLLLFPFQGGRLFKLVRENPRKGKKKYFFRVGAKLGQKRRRDCQNRAPAGGPPGYILAWQKKKKLALSSSRYNGTLVDLFFQGALGFGEAKPFSNRRLFFWGRYGTKRDLSFQVRAFIAGGFCVFFSFLALPLGSPRFSGGPVRSQYKKTFPVWNSKKNAVMGRNFPIYLLPIGSPTTPPPPQKPFLIPGGRPKKKLSSRSGKKFSFCRGREKPDDLFPSGFWALLISRNKVYRFPGIHF